MSCLIEEKVIINGKVDRWYFCSMPIIPFVFYVFFFWLLFRCSSNSFIALRNQAIEYPIYWIILLAPNTCSYKWSGKGKGRDTRDEQKYFRICCAERKSRAVIKLWMISICMFICAWNDFAFHIFHIHKSWFVCVCVYLTLSSQIQPPNLSLSYLQNQPMNQYSSSYSLVEIIHRSTISSNHIWLCGGFNYTRGIRAEVAVFIVWW